MSQKSLVKWIQGILIGFGICGLIFYGGLIPNIGLGLVDSYPEFGYMFYPWLIFILLTGIPCYIFLYFAWKITLNIDKDNSFCMDNSMHLKKMAYLALFDTVFFMVGNVIYFFLGMNHPATLLGSLLVVFVGVAISVACAALSHLVSNAAGIKEENDLTI